MKDVCTHSGNQLRELHYPVSHRNISDREQLAHNSKGAGFATQAVYISTHQKMYTGNGSKQHSGLSIVKKHPYKQAIWNSFRMKQGYLLDLLPMQSTHQRVQCPEDGVHGKGSIWDERGTLQPTATMRLTHLKEIYTPFPSATMQQHRPCPPTQVHSIRLCLSSCFYYMSRATTSTQELIHFFQRAESLGMSRGKAFVPAAPDESTGPPNLHCGESQKGGKHAPARI